MHAHPTIPWYKNSPFTFFMRWLAEGKNIFASSQSACTNFRAAPVGDQYQRGFKIYLAFASWCDSVPLISHLISHFTWGERRARVGRPPASSELLVWERANVYAEALWQFTSCNFLAPLSPNNWNYVEILGCRCRVLTFIKHSANVRWWNDGFW